MRSMPIKNVIVIFKTHLDIGFTDLARNVVARYFEHFIPSALRLAASCRAADTDERFVWTSGSWLIYEYLEQASTAARRELERAVEAGDIVWHALPFTSHTELMTPELFRAGLRYSRELDARYGRTTCAAKMTDVPGHTRAMLPLLKEAGVRFLHIGVNPACTVPDVPPLSRWEAPDGLAITLMYQACYGSIDVLPGTGTAVAIAFTGDNGGPQTPEQITDVYATLKRRYPGAAIRAGSFNDVAEALDPVASTLPRLTCEIGDTWIHGIGSDPRKVAAFRELLRLRKQWVSCGRLAENGASDWAMLRKLALVAEHTWGVDIKTHVGDWHVWKQADFAAARTRPNFLKAEESWEEQRAFLSQAADALPAPLADEARQAIRRHLIPAVPVIHIGAPLCSASGTHIQTPFFDVAFNGAGALCKLTDRANGRVWADADHALGLFAYQTFSHVHFAKYFRDYTTNIWDWVIKDIDKAGLVVADAADVTHVAQAQVVSETRTAAGVAIRLVLRPPAVLPPPHLAQFPDGVTVEWFFPLAEKAVQVTLSVANKAATRQPEALWFSFAPPGTLAAEWRLDKMGVPVSPLEVVSHGARRLHAVNAGVSWRGERDTLVIESLDVPLVAPGERTMLVFDDRLPQDGEGMHFNVFNNLWGTNFPMWMEGAFCARFNLRFS